MNSHKIANKLLLTICLLIHACAAIETSSKDIHHSTVSGLDPVAQNLIQLAFENNTAYEVTESLSMEVGPRLAGSTADKAAVAWGVKKLTELGFENVHTQTMQVPHWVRGSIKINLTSPYQINLNATALGGSVGTPPHGIDAEVVMTDTIETLNMIPDSEIAGKIVFFNRRMTAHKDGSGYSIAGKERWNGAQTAVKKGALAIVIRPAGTSHHRFAHTGSMGKYEEGFKKIPAASLSNADADILEYAFKQNPGQPINLSINMGSHYLPDETSANVIGELRGSEKPDQIILLGAHLDSWDLGTGAIDDASGIGIITAAVKLIMDAGIRPKRTLRVVFFANEEFGLSGAKEYARLNSSAVDQHVVGMESDFGAGKIWRFASKLPQEKLELKQTIFNNIESLGVEMGNNESGGGADLGPMRDLGMSTFSFTQDGSKYFHYHHTADDTLDKVDAEDLQHNVAIYAAAAYLAAMDD